MSGRKFDVFYQPPGASEWQRVGSAEVQGRAPTARERARALLAAADARLANPPSHGLRPEEQFERDMAKAVGAWGRYVEVEAERLRRTAESAIDWLAGRGHKKP